MNTEDYHGRIHGVIPTFLFACRLMIDMFVGLFMFRKIPNSITIYGSARLGPDSPYYKKAFKLGKRLAELDLTIMTGGGPGIMEAANHGAYSVKQKNSAGCHINLPFEQQQNPYLSISHETQFFFVRKYILRHSSQAVIAFPGGFGTMDEVFEYLTLIRTNCAPQVPVILIGTEYWKDLIRFVKETMLKAGTISEIDADFIKVTDDLDEAISIIQAAIDDQSLA